MSMKPKNLTMFFSIISDVYNHLYHAEEVGMKGENEVVLRFSEGYHAREFSIIMDDLIFHNKKGEPNE